MKCIHCGSDQIVVIKISGNDTENVRTYGCNNCHKHSTSVEKMQTSVVRGIFRRWR